MSRKKYVESYIIDSKALGERLRSLRGSMRQEDFAKALGCSQAQISRIENGENLPSHQLLSRISKWSGKPPSWILTGRGVEDYTPQALSFAGEELYDVPEPMRLRSGGGADEEDDLTPEEKRAIDVVMGDPEGRRYLIFLAKFWLSEHEREQS